MSTKTVPKKQLKSSDFVHLHNHSHYSLLDGLQKVPEMLDRVEKLGMEAIALTDHGTMSGTIEFYKEAKARGIKPIIGMEAYVAPRSHEDKSGKPDANPFHLTLLAMNNQGYENLMRLATLAYLEGYYYRPRIDRKLLKKYNAGLIVLSGCVSGELGDAIRQGQIKAADDIVQWYHEVFGDRYYLELQDHGHMWDEQKRINDHLLKLSQKYNIPAVVTADAHYSIKSDQDAHEVLLCVQTGALLEDESRMTLRDMDLFISDPQDIAEHFTDHPELLTNTRLIADRCNVEIEFDHLLLPKFPLPKGITENQKLEELTYRGLAWRYGGKSRAEAEKLSISEAIKLVDKATVHRAQYELETIASLGFSGYFLVVADFINWAKDRGIIVGPGRGSAAGSIVSYVLNVTSVDPMAYGLLFERFLNPDRISMPDIDIDFQDDRRDEVIKYVVDKYGDDRVAHIVTFGTMAARNAIRDTSRVLGVPYADADRLAKMVPPPAQGRHVPLAEHLKKVPDLQAEYQHNPTAKAVFDLAMRLEGTIRSHGVHAAGVVIAPDEIVKFTPLEVAQKGVIATQYSMLPIESLGLLKMDFLGLSNLTIIKNALRIIRKVYKKEINLAELPMDDAKTFALLSRGETTGVFQLESAGMKRYIKRLKPNQFGDIQAMVALYRPGPLAEIPRYIAGKHRPEQIDYPHQLLEPILKETYGVMVYQEQIIAMLQLIAGYTPGEADLVRKAIGKKKRDIMQAEEPRFIKGCQKKGLNETQARNLWALIQPFADYSFNRAHAACYGLIAYQTAYLKAYYPDAFMAALMTSDHEDTDRIAIEIKECRQMGLEVLPPDINESFVEFGIVPGKKTIRFSLSAIKNVGDGAAEQIVEARGNKPFKSMEDFIQRVNPQVVNRKTLESLAKAGAFDNLADRADLLSNLDTVVAFAGKFHKQASTGQVDLFADQAQDQFHPSLHLAPASEEISERERLGWERQLLGVYLSKHPMESYEAYLKDNCRPIIDISVADEGRQVKVAGFITAVRKILTRNGASMAFVAIEDLAGTLELIIFPKLYEETPALWEVDKIIVAQGKVSSKDREGHTTTDIKILADSAQELIHEQAINYKPSAVAKQTSLVINIPDQNDKDKLSAMRKLLDQNRGDSEVILLIGQTNPTRIKLPFKVQLSPQLQVALSQLFSDQAVTVQ